MRGEYFEAAGKLLCSACAAARTAGGKSAFLRALGFGAGAAFLGTIIWFAILKLTGSELGIIAIGVGLLVGAAVRKGAHGAGGWKYQTLAMVLTYVSVTASYVPLVIKGALERDKSANHGDGARDSDDDDAPAKAAAAPTDKAAATPAAPPSLGSVALFFAIVFGIALAAPFLGGASNIVGIFIIGIALYEAWKLNRRVPVNGPFRVELVAASAPPSPPVGATP